MRVATSGSVSLIYRENVAKYMKEMSHQNLITSGIYLSTKILQWNFYYLWNIGKCMLTECHFIFKLLQNYKLSIREHVVCKTKILSFNTTSNLMKLKKFEIFYI